MVSSNAPSPSPNTNTASDALPPLESLKCVLCKDYFTDPLTLPCLHSFCQNCLAAHLQSEADAAAAKAKVKTKAKASVAGSGKEATEVTEGSGADDEEGADVDDGGDAAQEDGAANKAPGPTSASESKEGAAPKPIKCPVCVGELSRPVPDVYTEPFENARLARIVKLVHETNVLCQNCSSTASEVTCDTCRSYQCRPCLEATHAAPVFKNHTHEALRHSEMNALPKCPQHPVSDLEFFCTDEEIGVCQVCLLKGDFVGRSYRLVSDVRVERQAEIDAGLRSVLVQRKKLVEAKVKAQGVLNALEENAANQEQAVRDNFQAIREALDRREAETMKALDDLKSAKAAAVTMQLESVEQEIKGIDDGVNSTQLVLNHSNDLELVYMTYVLQNHVTNVSQVPSTAPTACASCKKKEQPCHCTVVGPELPVQLSARVPELVGAYASVPSAESVHALMTKGDKATRATPQTPEQKQLMREVAQAADGDASGCVLQ